MITRKIPYSGEELAKIIIGKIELPDILDYHLCKGKAPVDSYYFTFINELKLGGSEGIYLDVGIEFLNGERIWIATFKTLRTDKEAYEIMGKLLGDFVFEGNEFVDINLDDFDFTDRYEKEWLKDRKSQNAQNSELWEVKGTDENENLTFAVCTSEKLAKAAVDTIVESGTGFDADSIIVTKSNICLNQVTIDDKTSNLK